jgi:hypothetical protein
LRTVQAYESSLQMEKDKFASSRREYENYIKLLQGLFARTARLHSSHARHNALLYTIHQGLQQMQAAERLVVAECDKLKSQGKTAKGKAATDPAAAADGSTPVLKVHLQKRNADLLLHVGMTIPTPMGDGVIEKIFPDSNKVVVKLPYGLMYAHLPRAMNWFSVATDAVDASNVLESVSGLHGVQQRFHESLQGCIFPPRAEAAGIRALVAQQRRGEEETGAVTDNDEVSVDGSEVGETSAASVSDQPPSQQEVPAAMDVADADGEDEPSMLRSSSTRRNGDSSNGEQPSAFPLPVFSASPPARSAVKKALETELSDEYAAILLQSLPLAFAPAGMTHLHQSRTLVSLCAPLISTFPQLSAHSSIHPLRGIRTVREQRGPESPAPERRGLRAARAAEPVLLLPGAAHAPRRGWRRRCWKRDCNPAGSHGITGLARRRPALARVSISSGACLSIWWLLTRAAVLFADTV